ncbi:UNVERIFIED_CONTAM: hypothetical protein RMT77_018124 [Armadillidium vulgare]
MFLVPFICYVSVGFYLVYWTNSEIAIDQFRDIFIDRHSWMAASREAFLVWGLHGAVLQQMASSNKKRHPLWRDTTILAIITIFGLVLASVCGLVFHSVLKENHLAYTPSSFETNYTRAFIEVRNQMDDLMLDRNGWMGPPEYMRNDPVYDNFYVGIRVREEYWSLHRTKTATLAYRSGYNCIRFLTEMFPALLFAKGDSILGVWAPLFYLGLLIFGLAHQLAVWHTVVQGLVRINARLLVPWETFIIFCSCLFAFSSSLLMATGLGIHIIYFLDYVIGCVWWIMILQLIMVFAVLFVRGKPYTAQSIAKNMFSAGKCCSVAWIVGPVAFSWTIMIPVGLLVLSISSFKTGNYREVFAWESRYWSTWTCQIASGLQLFPLLLVPLIGLIQTFRYLVNPKRDVFERIQYLYRPPPLRGVDSGYNEGIVAQSQEEADEDAMRLSFSGSDDTLNGGDGNSDSRPFSDPPPKYTPPPSYSTATGSGFTKLFGQSFRRSVRRLRNSLITSNADRTDLEASSNNPNCTSEEPYIPPPDYTQPPLRDRSPGPPQYATLDPIRIQRALRLFHSIKSGEITRDESNCNHSNSGATINDTQARNDSRSTGNSRNNRTRNHSRNQSEGNNSIFFLRLDQSPSPLSRSFSTAGADGERRTPGRLSRSHTSSLSRNARRLALNLATGITGEVLSRNPNGDDRGSQSQEYNRSLSNVELSMQSEA